MIAQKKVNSSREFAQSFKGCEQALSGKNFVLRQTAAAKHNARARELPGNTQMPTAANFEHSRKTIRHDQKKKIA